MKPLLPRLILFLFPVALSTCFLAAGCDQPAPPPKPEEKPKEVEIGKNVSLEV